MTNATGLQVDTGILSLELSGLKPNNSRVTVPGTGLQTQGVDRFIGGLQVDTGILSLELPGLKPTSNNPTVSSSGLPAQGIDSFTGKPASATTSNSPPSSGTAFINGVRRFFGFGTGSGGVDPNDPRNPNSPNHPSNIGRAGNANNQGNRNNPNNPNNPSNLNGPNNPNGQTQQNPIIRAIQNMINAIIAIFARAISNPFINIAIALMAITMSGEARALAEGEAAKSINSDNKTPFLEFIAQISGLHGLAKNKHETWKDIAKDEVTTNYRNISGGNG